MGTEETLLDFFKRTNMTACGSAWLPYGRRSSRYVPSREGDEGEEGSGDSDAEVTVENLLLRLSNLETAVSQLKDQSRLSDYVITMVLDSSGDFLVASVPYSGVITSLTIVYPPYRADTTTEYTLYVGPGAVMNYAPQVTSLDKSGVFMVDMNINQGAILKLYREASQTSTGDPVAEHLLGSWSASLTLQVSSSSSTYARSR